MRAYFAALLLCCAVGAQTTNPPIPIPFAPGTFVTTPPAIFLINSGGPDTPGDTRDPNNIIPPYIADKYFTGGVAWTDPTMGTGIWGTLRYGPEFTYDILVPNGLYTIKFDLLEPNQTAVGKRVFTIAANGIQSDPIDLFAMTGAINKQTSISLMASVGNGHMVIKFNATAGNAIVNAIELSPSYIFSGIEAHFIRIYTCDLAYPQTVCIQINPGAQPQYPMTVPPVPPQ
jgi:hypothetical protein